MTLEEARAILLRAFAATGELPAEQLTLIETLLGRAPTPVAD